MSIINLNQTRTVNPVIAVPTSGKSLKPEVVTVAVPQVQTVAQVQNAPAPDMSKGVSMAALIDQKIAQAMNPVNAALQTIMGALQNQQSAPQVQTAPAPAGAAQVPQVKAQPTQAEEKPKFDPIAHYNLTAVAQFIPEGETKPVIMGVSQGNKDGKYPGNVVVAGITGTAMTMTPKSFERMVKMCGADSPFAQYWAQVGSFALSLAGKK